MLNTFQIISELGQSVANNDGPAENLSCAEQDEIVHLVPQCHPGQATDLSNFLPFFSIFETCTNSPKVWAANKNPRCSFTYNDAVYQNEEATCSGEVNQTINYSCT